MEEEGKALTFREASPSPSGVQQGVAMVPSCCQSSSVCDASLLRKAQLPDSERNSEAL